ncbi:polysaccharide deacetylase family protein [Desulfovibrio sp. OttesenSCG-928-G15]|nr:polysaccharide deacetylase family protein [Desulfovibrio sp. OttesenSCG-928-G15]
MFFSLPVFTYHSISRHKDGLCVSPELFEEHCRTLADDGWRGVSLYEAEEYFLNGTPLAPKSCLFTFDDGYLDNYVYAEPILRRYGHHGIMFPVLNMLESHDKLRPTMEDASCGKDLKRFFDAVNKRKRVWRGGRVVEHIHFCSWQEVKHMQDNGNLCVAPHSLRHDRVICGLSFRRLNWPKRRPKGFFSVPPYDAPLGFPLFDNGHFLTERAYTLNPELFEIIKETVPQQPRAAKRFAANRNMTELIRQKLREVPALGTQESIAAQRERIAKEFMECQRIFKEQLGVTARSFCWPWGDSTPMALEEAQKAGFSVFFTTTPGPNPPGSPLRVHRQTVRGGSGKKLLTGTYMTANTLTSACHAFCTNTINEISDKMKKKKKKKRSFHCASLNIL